MTTDLAYPRGTRFRVKQETPPQASLVESERGFQEWVIGCAVTFRWRVYHTHDSQHSAEGFPDLIMLRGTRCVVAELKRVGKAPDKGLVEWLLAFARVPGCEVYCWDPSDRDAIERTLE
jgi:hypothetical protein